MEEKDKREVIPPRETSCGGHQNGSVGSHCKLCKERNRIIRENFLQELTWEAGKIICENWKKYYDAAEEKLKKKEQRLIPSATTVVAHAKETITKDLYPWKGHGHGHKVWRDVLNILARHLHDNYVPVTKKAKEELW